jgi:antitoxin CptB
MATAGPPISELDLRRLRWRCRRGLLENDLVLDRFLDRHAASLDAQSLQAFNELLELGDNDLWDLLAGRSEPDEERHRPLVALLRQC